MKLLDLNFWKTEETKEEIPKEEKKEDKFDIYLGKLCRYKNSHTKNEMTTFNSPEHFVDWCDEWNRIPLKLYGVDISNKILYEVKFPKKKICYNYE